MEVPLLEAGERLAELVVAAQSGERVVITERGQPVVELVPFGKSGGIDFDRLASACARLGIEEDVTGWPAEFDEPALSRRVLGAG